MQDGLSALSALFVVPVHDSALVARVDGIVVDVLGQLHRRAAELVRELRVILFEDVVVLERDVEQVLAALNVRDAGLPEQIDKVRVHDVDVSEPVVLGRVPEDAVHAGPALDFVVLLVVVGSLEAALVQNNRDDRRKDLRLVLVTLLPRQDVRGREVVHCVGVFVGNAVQKPCARRLHLPVIVCGSHALPLAELVPLFVVDEALLQVVLSLLVVLKGLVCLGNLRAADRLPLVRVNAAVVRDRAHVQTLGNGHVSGIEAVEAVSCGCRAVSGEPSLVVNPRHG